MVSVQIKVLTDEMKVEVHAQRETLNKIEQHKEVVVDNTDKAAKEINKGNEISKKNRNKMFWFIALAVFVAIIIIVLLLYLTVFNKSDK